jgi:hypothetical protein
MGEGPPKPDGVQEPPKMEGGDIDSYLQEAEQEIRGAKSAQRGISEAAEIPATIEKLVQFGWVHPEFSEFSGVMLDKLKVVSQEIKKSEAVERGETSVMLGGKKEYVAPEDVHLPHENAERVKRILEIAHRTVARWTEPSAEDSARLEGVRETLTKIRATKDLIAKTEYVGQDGDRYIFLNDKKSYRDVADGLTIKALNPEMVGPQNGSREWDIDTLGESWQNHIDNMKQRAAYSEEDEGEER